MSVSVFYFLQHCGNPVEIHHVSGDHFTMLQQPHVRKIAQILKNVWYSNSNPESDSGSTPAGSPRNEERSSA